MINKAIAKITDEMMKKNDALARMIEEHLTNKCTSITVAEKILDPEKSLETIHEKIWDEARKRKDGNGAFIPDAEVYEMIDKYYDIGSGRAGQAKSAVRINAMDLL